MKPIGVSLSRDGVQETMKPQNHATKKPVNISLFRYGVHGEINNETECDIRENFDTNKCPNIFVSTKLHE